MSYLTRPIRGIEPLSCELAPRAMGGYLLTVDINYISLHRNVVTSFNYVIESESHIEDVKHIFPFCCVCLVEWMFNVIPDD
jgi:hypothetical protein